MTVQALIWIFLLAAGVIAYYIDIQSEHLLRCIFFHMFSGFLSLAALWGAGHFIEISLSATPFSIAGAAIFGVPGVLAMLLVCII